MWYQTPNYYQEPWYPMFLMAFVTCLFVVFATCVVEVIQSGHKPTYAGTVIGAVGMFLAVHPYGLALYLILTTSAIQVMPWKFGMPLAFVGVVAFLNFWATLLGRLRAHS